MIKTIHPKWGSISWSISIGWKSRWSSINILAKACSKIHGELTEVINLKILLKGVYRPKKNICKISSHLAYHVELIRSMNLKRWLKQIEDGHQAIRRTTTVNMLIALKAKKEDAIRICSCIESWRWPWSSKLRLKNQHSQLWPRGVYQGSRD